MKFICPYCPSHPEFEHLKGLVEHYEENHAEKVYTFKNSQTIKASKQRTSTRIKAPG